jgi:hypothetical protein
VTSLSVDVLVQAFNYSQLHLSLLALGLSLLLYCISYSTTFVATMRSFALAFPALVTAYLAYAPSEASDALQNILKNTDRTDKYRYPTDFTRDIEPVRIERRSLHVRAYATIETLPQPQRLLARRALFFWTRSGRHIHRGRCLVDRWYTLCRFTNNPTIAIAKSVASHIPAYAWNCVLVALRRRLLHSVILKGKNESPHTLSHTIERDGIVRDLYCYDLTIRLVEEGCHGVYCTSC